MVKSIVKVWGELKQEDLVSDPHGFIIEKLNGRRIPGTWESGGWAPYDLINKYVSDEVTRISGEYGVQESTLYSTISSRLIRNLETEPSDESYEAFASSLMNSTNIPNPRSRETVEVDEKQVESLRILYEILSEAYCPSQVLDFHGTNQLLPLNQNRKSATKYSFRKGIERLTQNTNERKTKLAKKLQRLVDYEERVHSGDFSKAEYV